MDSLLRAKNILLLNFSTLNLRWEETGGATACKKNEGPPPLAPLAAALCWLQKNVICIFLSRQDEEQGLSAH